MLEKLKQAIAERKSAALIMSEENVRYFTSFTSSNGILFVTGKKAYYFTDSRYIEAAQNKVKGCDEVLLLKSFAESVVPVVMGEDFEYVEIEAEKTTVSRFIMLKTDLPDKEIIMDFLDDTIDEIREVKSKEEEIKTEKAQRIAEAALDVVLPKIKVGKTERELSLELDYTMLKMGAEALSFETIFVSGKKSSMPHGVPSDKKIENGDFVTIDFGAVYESYHSDMTRTFAVGSVSDKMADVYNTVLNAQLKSLEALKPGAECKAVDAVARNIITEKGYGDCFGHGLGHGVGVEIHEYPNLSPKSQSILKVGNIVTVEPGIYIPGEFGVRIEDMAIITEEGYKNFTLYRKDLIVL